MSHQGLPATAEGRHEQTEAGPTNAANEIKSTDPRITRIPLSAMIISNEDERTGKTKIDSTRPASLPQPTCVRHPVPFDSFVGLLLNSFAWFAGAFISSRSAHRVFQNLRKPRILEALVNLAKGHSAG
jgi:hypothetical protein